MSTKQKTSRIMALLLTLCMVFTMLPMTALAAPTTTTPITAVAVTNAMPVVGESCSTDGITITTSPANAAVEKRSTWWEDTAIGQTPLSSTDKFVEWHKYILSVELEPNAGFAFEMEASGNYGGTATFNGVVAIYAKRPSGSDTSLYINSKTVTATAGGGTTTPTPITTIDVSGITIPVVGAKPDFFVTLPEGANYHLATAKELSNAGWTAEQISRYTNGVFWRNLTDDSYLTSTDAFAADKTYYLGAMLVPDPGYKFDSTTTATLNGSSALVGLDANPVHTSGIFRFFSTTWTPVAPTPITTVDIYGLTPPAPGKTPDYEATVPAGANYHIATDKELADSGRFSSEILAATKNGIKWREAVSGRDLSPTETFKADEKYRALVFVFANDGYKFTTEPTMTINGITGNAFSGLVIGNDECNITTTVWTAVEPTPISAVDISGITLPVVGATPDFDVTLPEGANYHLATAEELSDAGWTAEQISVRTNGVGWRNKTGNSWLTSTDKFEADKKYYISVVLMPNTGYEFTDATTATVNGSTANEDGSFKFTNYNAFNAFSVDWTPSLATAAYDVWVNGTQVTSNNKADILTDGTASYDPNSQTLTLDDYKGGAIRANQALTITLADGSENTVTNPESNKETCIYTDNADLTINGSGDLTVVQKNEFRSAIGTGDNGGNLTVDMAGDLTVTSVGWHGLFAFGSVTISGSGDVSISIEADGSGIVAKSGDIILSGSGKLTVDTRTAENNAVWFGTSGKSLLLNGTGTPLSFSSGTGYAAIYNGPDEDSPVGGTNLAYYDKVTGAPDTTSVVYDHGTTTPTVNGDFTPVAGAAPNYTGTISESGWHFATVEEMSKATFSGVGLAGNSKNGIVWFKDGTPMDTGAVFASGSSYTGKAYLLPDSVDLVGLWTAKVSTLEQEAAAEHDINGDLSGYMEHVANGLPVINAQLADEFTVCTLVNNFNIGAASTTTFIDSVAVTNVPTPVAGQPCSTDSITMTTNPDKAAEIKQIYWWDETNSKRMSSTDTFVEGNKYSLSVALEPNAGYTFEFNTSGNYTGTATFNNEAANRVEDLYGSATGLFIASKIATATAGGGTDPGTGSGTNKTVMAGTAQIKGAQTDNVYFGTYKQTSDGNGGYNVDPIKWRVLSNKNGKLFLLADQNLDVLKYHTDYESVTWEESTMRSWLNGYDASANTGGASGEDYSADNFLNTAFLEKELVAVSTTNVVNADNQTYNTSGGENTKDKVFLLSIDEAKSETYGFTNSTGATKTRKATNTAYAAERGGLFGAGAYAPSWMRSPGEVTHRAAYVENSGMLNEKGLSGNSNRICVRPAFNLDLSSVLFTSAAVGGKVPIPGSTDDIFEIGDYNGNEWKLTLIDSERNFAVTETSANGKRGDTVTLNYTGATIGANEYISVLITDDSGAKYYGRIAQPDSAADTVSFKIPNTLADGTYTLCVFSEQYNGGTNDDTKLTDYASAFETVTLTVSGIYTVTFDANGHGTAPTALTNVVSGTEISAPTAPAASGYTFGGWYKDASCTNAWNFGTDTVTGNITLYAKWTAVTPTTEKYTVTFNANGHGTAPAALTNVASGTEISVPTAPVASGYTFGGWDKDASCTNAWNFGTDTVTSNITLYAKWTVVAPTTTYTVTFNANGATCGTTTATTGTDGKLTSLPTATRSGSYNFKGWYTAAIGGTKITTDYVFTANTTVYAQWTYTGGGFGGGVIVLPANYTLTFNTNGGSKIDSVSKTSGTTIDLASYNPTKDGYTFDGWYADTKLTDKVTSVKLFVNTTVYAKWVQNPGTGAADLPFIDVKRGDWFYDDVAYVFEESLMNGTSSTTFSPNMTTTRGMIVTVLYRQAGSPTVSGNCSFNDVKSGMYYEAPIAWAAANGIVNGYSADKFGPDDPIIREQMAAILYRYAQYKGIDVSAKADLSKYNDAAKVSDWAKDAIAWTVQEGIFNGVGDSMLSPETQATRAQIAAILHRFCENIAK